MINYNYKELNIGENSKQKIYLLHEIGNHKVLRDKEYFNKHTKEIHILKCKLTDKNYNIIDENKEVVLITVWYSSKLFNSLQRILKKKEYVYIDNVIYQTGKDIKYMPKEVKYALNEVLI